MRGQSTEPRATEFRSGMGQIVLRDFKPEDAAAVNQIALAAFDQFRDSYDNWPEFRARIGQMSSLSAPLPELKVIALTVITSLADEDLPEIGLAPSVRAQVERLAVLAADCGCHGVVASANEAEYLVQRLPDGTLIVTPGIQLAGDEGNDQMRVATPRAARVMGATHVVIGRSIAQASDPVRAFREAANAMAGASRV